MNRAEEGFFLFSSTGFSECKSYKKKKLAKVHSLNLRVCKGGRTLGKRGSIYTPRVLPSWFFSFECMVNFIRTRFGKKIVNAWGAKCIWQGRRGCQRKRYRRKTQDNHNIIVVVFLIFNMIKYLKKKNNIYVKKLQFLEILKTQRLEDL